VTDHTLRRLLDDLLAQERTDARRRQRAMTRSLEEGAGLVGALVDLAEAATEVVVRTSSGRAHHGRIVAVGADFAVVAGAVEAWVRLVAVTSVLVPPAGPVPSGDRPGADVRFVEAIARLAEDRPWVRVVLPGDTVAGTLVAMGADVLTVRPPEGSTAYVSAVSITEVLRSG
jgi:hypothetical protein